MTEPDDDLTLGEHLDPDERDLEAPPDDAAEQAAPVKPSAKESTGVHRGWEVNDWDAAEQAMVVEIDDEDDYR